MRRAAALLVALAVGWPAAAGAQLFRYLAHGDSITEGFNDSASCTGCQPSMVPGGCGYTKDTRLPSAAMLDCAANGCQVVNHGMSFELSGPGITRLANLFASDPDWDVLILMHGSNDLFQTVPVPEEAVRDNLKQMAHDAAELGIDTVHASIIRFHYLGDWGMTRDGAVDNLGALVQALAAAENRYFSDQRATMCGNETGTVYRDCQNFFYCEDNPGGATPAEKWTIGHPKPIGFDIMAQAFFNTLTAAGVPAAPAPTSPAGNLCVTQPPLAWSKESPDRATWYQVELETALGAGVFDDWLPEANVSAINADPLIPGACAGTACAAVPPFPLSPGDYVWRVRGRNPNGRSPFSADLAFTVFEGNPGPLTNHTVTGIEVREICGTIQAGNFGAGDYVVAATGDLTLHAEVAVELFNGFSVLAGGDLTVRLGL